MPTPTPQERVIESLPMLLGEDYRVKYIHEKAIYRYSVEWQHGTDGAVIGICNDGLTAGDLVQRLGNNLGVNTVREGNNVTIPRAEFHKIVSPALETAITTLNTAFAPNVQFEVAPCSDKTSFGTALENIDFGGILGNYARFRTKDNEGVQQVTSRLREAGIDAYFTEGGSGFRGQYTVVIPEREMFMVVAALDPCAVPLSTDDKRLAGKVAERLVTADDQQREKYSAFEDTYRSVADNLQRTTAVMTVGQRATTAIKNDNAVPDIEPATHVSARHGGVPSIRRLSHTPEYPLNSVSGPGTPRPPAGHRGSRRPSSRGHF